MLNKTLDEVVNVTVDRPMYLPISSSSINNIEVNIRDDFGRPVNFLFGSKVILTIHLRKVKG